MKDVARFLYNSVRVQKRPFRTYSTYVRPRVERKQNVSQAISIDSMHVSPLQD